MQKGEASDWEEEALLPVSPQDCDKDELESTLCHVTLTPVLLLLLLVVQAS